MADRQAGEQVYRVNRAEEEAQQQTYSNQINRQEGRESKQDKRTSRTADKGTHRPLRGGKHAGQQLDKQGAAGR